MCPNPTDSVHLGRLVMAFSRSVRVWQDTGTSGETGARLNFSTVTNFLPTHKTVQPGWWPSSSCFEDPKLRPLAEVINNHGRFGRTQLFGRMSVVELSQEGSTVCLFVWLVVCHNLCCCDTTVFPSWVRWVCGLRDYWKCMWYAGKELTYLLVSS
jgi:hypothetical protein